MRSHLHSKLSDLRTDLRKWRLMRIGPQPKIWQMDDRLVLPHVWEKPNMLKMGSYQANGRMDPETALFRRYHPRQHHRLGLPHDKLPVAVETLDRGLFGGPLFPAYGHFLLESLARLWAAPKFPDHPILWSVSPSSSAPQIFDWMAEILAILDISNPIVLVQHPTSVTKLIVPAPGYEIQYRFGLTHSRFLGRIPWEPVRGRKLWVSRARVEEPAGDGREKLEHALHMDGWNIIRPEAMSIAAQMRELASAERIAGEQGSALHSLILMRPAKKLRLDVFARDPRLEGHFVNANQETICMRRQIDYRFHRMIGERVTSQNGPRITKTFCDPAEYLRCLASS